MKNILNIQNSRVTAYRTIMGYYSNPAVTLPATGTPTGVAGESDVARVFMENIDTVSALGDESASCSSATTTTTSSCEGRCEEKCAGKKGRKKKRCLKRCLKKC